MILHSRDYLGGFYQRQKLDKHGGLFLFIFLREGMREREREIETERQRQRESQADSMLSTEPETGLDPMTLGS